jgi:Glycosyl transferase family 64 domain
MDSYPQGKLKFEVHSNNSLSNRFRPLIDIPTEAVLSIDDDLIVPCSEVERTAKIWAQSPRVLVVRLFMQCARYQYDDVALHISSIPLKLRGSLLGCMDLTRSMDIVVIIAGSTHGGQGRTALC